MRYHTSKYHSGLFFKLILTISWGTFLMESIRRILWAYGQNFILYNLACPSISAGFIEPIDDIFYVISKLV